MAETHLEPRRTHATPPRFLVQENPQRAPQAVNVRFVAGLLPNRNARPARRKAFVHQFPQPVGMFVGIRRFPALREGRHKLVEYAVQQPAELGRRQPVSRPGVPNVRRLRAQYVSQKIAVGASRQGFDARGGQHLVAGARPQRQRSLPQQAVIRAIPRFGPGANRFEAPIQRRIFLQHVCEDRRIVAQAKRNADRRKGLLRFGHDPVFLLLLFRGKKQFAQLLENRRRIHFPALHEVPPVGRQQQAGIRHAHQANQVPDRFAGTRPLQRQPPVGNAFPLLVQQNRVLDPRPRKRVLRQAHDQGMLAARIAPPLQRNHVQMAGARHRRLGLVAFEGIDQGLGEIG